MNEKQTFVVTVEPNTPDATSFLVKADVSQDVFETALQSTAFRDRLRDSGKWNCSIAGPIDLGQDVVEVPQ